MDKVSVNINLEDIGERRNVRYFYIKNEMQKLFKLKRALNWMEVSIFLLTAYPREWIGLVPDPLGFSVQRKKNNSMILKYKTQLLNITQNWIILVINKNHEL